MLPPRTPKASLKGTIEAKYAVIGAGFTGLAAARRLADLDPGADIVVLEATTVGEGSSARNSGFISPGDLTSGLSADDLARCEALNGFASEGFADLRDLIDKHGIDCDLNRCGRIKAAATEAGEAAVDALAEIVRALRLPHAMLGREELAARTGTAYYRRALQTQEGYLIQPAALVRGVADALPSAVRLFERSPVRRLERAGKWRLDCGEGRVVADTVIMATNAAIKGFGYLRDRLVTIYTYAAITKPLPQSDVASLGAMPYWGVLPAHRLGTTVRRVGRDRLMVRSLYSYERGVPTAKARDELTARFRRRYPDLGHVDLDYCWGGTTALTMNGSPYWGKVDDRLYAFAGCNGAGVVKGTILGKRLAEEAAGRGVAADVVRTYGTASWIAPEPFRTVGFHVVSAIERRKAGLES